MDEMMLRRMVPVYIPYFNQPTYLLKMVSKLVGCGFKNVNVLVNGAQTDTSKNALVLLDSCREVNVVLLQQNMGPRVLFQTQLIEYAPKLFLYTDPDLKLPEPLPDNFLTRLVEISERYKVGKVGCALKLEPEKFSKWSNFAGLEYDAVKAEGDFWTRPVEPDVYAAMVDTTFCLVNKTYYALDRFFDGLRVAGGWEVKHLPWYQDQEIPQAEMEEYMEAKLRAPWMAAELKSWAGSEQIMENIAGGREQYQKWLREKGIEV